MAAGTPNATNSTAPGARRATGCALATRQASRKTAQLLAPRGDALVVELLDGLDQVALVVVVHGDQVDRQPVHTGAAVRARQDELLLLEWPVGAQPRWEEVAPVVEHEERAVGGAALALAAQLIATSGAERRVLDEREPVEVPGHGSVGVLLGEDDHAAVAPYQLAERGERLVAGEGGHVAVQIGSLEGLRDLGGGHVGLDEQDHDLAPVVVEELPNHLEGVDHAGG